jgi:dihydrofolate reductase
MIISAIAACSSNRVIGRDNELPWHLPADMRYFMRTTKGHHVIMGRKTFESLGKPLKNRVNVVITHNPFYMASGIVVVHSLEEALQYARENEEEEAFIIGGAEIYRQSLSFLDRIYLTEIDLVVEDGDAFFPSLDEERWKLVSEEPHAPDDRNEHPFSFNIYHKRE